MGSPGNGAIDTMVEVCLGLDSEPPTLRRGNAPPSSDRVHVTWDGQSAEPVESLDGVSIPPAPVRSTWLDRIVFGLTGALLGALVYCVCFGCTPDKPARAPGPVCSPNVYESRCL
jgi:hypothetical protein